MSEENKNLSEHPEEDSLDAEEMTVDGAEPMTCSDDAGEPPHIDPDSALFSDGAQEPKRSRRVSLLTFVCTSVALVLAAVMLTYTICSSVYQKKLAEAKLDNVSLGTSTQTGSYSELDVLRRIFETYSFEELDNAQIREQLLKAYVAATGDAYAEYYTGEEYAALSSDMAGESQGIGINIINSTVTVSGYEYKALKVINVIKDSPAENAEVKVGDFIWAVGSTKAEYTTIDELGYDVGLAKLQGVKGTDAEFVVMRPVDGGYKAVDFKITREEFTNSSVMYTVADADVSAKTGIVKIVNFDLTTPAQLTEAVDTLKAQGCEKFVFDVRYNPGGILDSIVAVLSYFLEEGDTVISVKDNRGNEEVTKVAEVTYEGDSAGCSVTKADIGKYKDLDMVVLCNESTASAAELFVANFRDHKLGAVVGTTTFGKGSMQSYMNLAYFGMDGVLKLTTRMYFPPSGESYEGIGITPDVAVELSEAAMSQNVYDIMGKAIDNQLTEAVKHFKNS